MNTKNRNAMIMNASSRGDLNMHFNLTKILWENLIANDFLI